MEHIVHFEAGHDCIKFECKFGKENCIPGQGGSHGKHGLAIRFASKGDDGAVLFTIYTGWEPQFAMPDSISHRNISKWSSIDVMPADLGYHSKIPHYKEQTPTSENCEYCDGKPCYYDGSALNATDAMYALVNGGEDALWKFLDEYYECVFAGGEYPEPAEYEKRRR